MLTVGADFGSESVKIVCLDKRRNEYNLVSYGLFYRDQQDPIREVLLDPRLRRAEFRVSMKDSMVKIHKLELPPAPPEDLDAMVKMAMSQILSEPIDNYILRYQPTQKVVLISEKKLIENYLLELKPFGIVNPAILEPKVHTLVHAALHNHPLSREQQYTIVDIGKSIALFSVISENGLVFNRNLSNASGFDLMSHIAQDLKLPIEDIDARQRADPTFFSLQHPESKNAFIQWLYKIAIEIQNSIENYQLQFAGQKVEELLLTGGLAKTPGLSGYIGDTLKIKTGHLKAFQKINTSKFPQVAFENIEHHYATAVGLAL